jgi:hypothetical protein
MAVQFVRSAAPLGPTSGYITGGIELGRSALFASSHKGVRVGIFDRGDPRCLYPNPLAKKDFRKNAEVSPKKICVKKTDTLSKVALASDR